LAKSRAQRKAEQRKRQARRQQGQDGQSAAQHRTQVPESADVAEAELAEHGANLDELRGTPAEPEAPAPSRGETAPAKAAAPLPAEAPAEEVEPPADKITRREQKRLERERKQAARASIERRKPRDEPVERERGRVMGFLASCVAELRRVQWPNRDTLIQASAVTLVFIAVAAAYLGVLDGAFNWLVQRIL
jgi:preprotein translocase SecE subunit